jgi:hypothetical protein
VPLAEDIAIARANLWRAQQRMDCYPRCAVWVNGHGFYMDCEDEDGASEVFEPALRCYIPEPLLEDILHRRVHYNNAEIGCLIEFDRKGPYMPDVHMLMSFFHLPRPT